MARLFGTDGVRGLANGEVITGDFALGLAQAAATVLTQGRHAERRRAEGRRPRAVIARDPRISGEFISAAVAAGLASSGIDVLDAGVIPTPAAAFLVADIDADFGVVVSASHNPAPDNGIKFFAYGGTKLPDDVEDRIEAALASPDLLPTGADVGRIRRFADAETATCCTSSALSRGSGSTGCTSSSTARTALRRASRRSCSWMPARPSP